MSQTGPTLRRYYLPNVKYEGWAEIVTSDQGFFAVVSDFGNYAFRWSAFAGDFRRFLIGLDADYLMSKLGERNEYDGEATCKAAKAELIRARKDGELSMDEARNAWDLIGDSGDLELKEDFSRWLDEMYESSIPLIDLYELAEYTWPGDLRGFCEKVWPRFVAVLKAELYMEKAGQ